MPLSPWIRTSGHRHLRAPRSVTPEQARVSGEYLLDLEDRDFQAKYADDKTLPTVRVGLVGRLIRIADRQLLETIIASNTGAAKENRLNTVTAAFESASQSVALDLARQTAAAVVRDQSQKSVDDKVAAARRSALLSDQRSPTCPHSDLGSGAVSVSVSGRHRA